LIHGPEHAILGSKLKHSPPLEITMKDVGDKCVYCGVDTSYGSGNFVNRIPAGTETEEGYMCPNCQMVECDECGMDTLDYEMKPEGGVICSDCYDESPCPDDDDYP
jgi:hypothetical protein